MKSHKNPWKVVVSIALVLTAWIYGRLFGEFSNRLTNGEIDIISPERFANYTLVAIFFITMVRMVFPSYKPLKQIFPKHFPLSKIQRNIASILNDFVTPFFFYLFVFILTGSFYADNQRIKFLFYGFVTLLGSHLLRRCFQYYIDFRLSKVGQLVSILVFTILLISFTILDFQLIIKPQLLLMVCFLFLIGFIQEITIIESRNKEFTSKTYKNKIILKLLLNNKKARLPLIIGFILKAFILLADLFLFKAKGKHLFDGQIVFWLFASPLIIFSYVFNNIWGFWKNIWLNMDIRIGEYKPMIKMSFGLMLLPLSIDVIVTIPILLLGWSNSEFILLFYFTTACYLIMLSFLWSLITPRKITSTFQMKGSTSPLSIIAAMGGVLLLTTMKLNQWFYFLIPLFLIIGGIAFWLSIDIYKDKKYLITNKIMKE